MGLAYVVGTHDTKGAELRYVATARAADLLKTRLSRR